MTAARNFNLTLSISDDTSTEPLETPGSRVGLGLVEISALGTLIGATSAEALASGNKAAAGLPWASMSTFGSLYCAKAAIACLVPDWARDSLGLKSSFVDSALGLNIAIDTRTNAKQRAKSTDTAPCGVWIPYHGNPQKQIGAIFNQNSFTPIKPQDSFSSASSSSRASTVSGSLSGNIDAYDRFRRHLSQSTSFFTRWNLGAAFHMPHAAYVFDRATTLTLGTIIPSEGKDGIKIHVYYRDQSTSQTLTDWLAIAASPIKLLEVAVLYKLEAKKLWWITAIAWVPTYLSTLFLQICAVGRDDCDVGEIDLIAGELPSPLHPGGAGKLLLGVPGNTHRSLVWKFHWFIQALACIAGAIAVFIVLSNQEHKVIYVWAAFQTLWMILRVIIYHNSWLARSGPAQAMVMGRSWDASSLATRRRAIQLVFALARQQVTIHPRGVYSYQEDFLVVSELSLLWSAANWSIDDMIPVDQTLCFSNPSTIPSATTEKHISLQVIGVVGDTVLRSTAWVKGLGLSNPDIYDSVLIFVKLLNSSRIYCVPCARVLRAVHTNVDTESIGGLFGARGTRNTGEESVSWNYWIPLDLPATPATSTVNSHTKDQNMYWVEIQGMKIVGKQHQGLIRSSEGLQNHLQAGLLTVSLSQVEEVREIITTARKATMGLKEMLLSVQQEKLS